MGPGYLSGQDHPGQDQVLYLWTSSGWQISYAAVIKPTLPPGKHLHVLMICLRTRALHSRI